MSVGAVLVTLEDLLAAGAHRTLEYVATHEILDVATAADFLSRRFGNLLQPEPGALPALIGRVQDAVRAGALTNSLESPLEAEIPVVPGYPQGYSYTVIGELADPLAAPDSGKTVTFPIRINSQRILSYDELQNLANDVLNQVAQSPESRINVTVNSPPGIRNAIAQLARDETGEEAPYAIKVLSVYRGA